MAYESYFQDQAAWKKNFVDNNRTLNDLYKKRINKREADRRVVLHEQELQQKEDLATTIKMQELEQKDSKGKEAVVAGLTILAVIALVAVAANNGGLGGSGSGNSYAENPCDCPGDLDSAGNRCGMRSAYSRAGGASPYCPAFRL